MNADSSCAASIELANTLGELARVVRTTTLTNDQANGISKLLNQIQGLLPSVGSQVSSYFVFVMLLF